MSNAVVVPDVLLNSELAAGELLTPEIAESIVLTAEADPTNSLFTSLIEFLQIGGPVVWVLGLFSIIALTLIFFKCLQYFSLRLDRRADIEKSLVDWQAGNIGSAASSLKISLPISKIVLHAQQACCDSYSRYDLDKSNRENLLETHKEELSRQAQSLMHRLRSFLKPLEIIATLSPLLGLLGTVLGMIEAFKQMEIAGSQVDPSVLSGGIWQALLTTAVGLAVAIPVVMAHSYFDRKCERVAFYLNDAVTRVFTKLPSVLTSSSTAPSEKAHAA